MTGIGQYSFFLSSGLMNQSLKKSNEHVLGMVVTSQYDEEEGIDEDVSENEDNVLFCFSLIL